MSAVEPKAVEEKAPVRRVTFYELPGNRLALHHLDGWGFVEMGATSCVVARYKHFATRGQARGWPVEPVLLHAVIDKALRRLGRPVVLVELLRHRYPRQGGEHKGSFESFEHPELQRMQQRFGAPDWIAVDMIQELEKEFVRSLVRGLGK